MPSKVKATPDVLLRTPLTVLLPGNSGHVGPAHLAGLRRHFLLYMKSTRGNPELMKGGHPFPQSPLLFPGITISRDIEIQLSRCAVSHLFFGLDPISPKLSLMLSLDLDPLAVHLGSRHKSSCVIVGGGLSVHFSCRILSSQ